METLLTSREFAEAIGASESSVRRWTNSGTIATARTAGGHRRITLAEAIRFVRESGVTLQRPELLGLPPVPVAAAGKSLGNTALAGTLYDALLNGQASAAHGSVSGLFLNGMTAAQICDTAVQPAMERIGNLWIDDRRGVLIEHRATDICLSSLRLLRRMIPDHADAPVALGGAPEGDPYLLPSLMASVVVAEAGYRDLNFGPNTPLDLLATAAAEHQARLVWLAIKSSSDRPRLRTQIHALSAKLAAVGADFVLGGTDVDALDLRPAPGLHVMRTMSELAAFARGVATQSRRPTSAQ